MSNTFDCKIWIFFCALLLKKILITSLPIYRRENMRKQIITSINY